MGRGKCARREVHLYGGELTLTSMDGVRMQTLSRSGTNIAAVVLGDLSGSCTITQSVADVAWYVGDTTTSSNTFLRVEGWCESIHLTGTLRNNGRIIANGWGENEDRTLDFRSFSSVSSTKQNTPSNGWFAVNRAKLQLPDLAFSAADPARAWGDMDWRSAGDLELVNSLHISLNDLTADGTLSITLLATDRSDVSSAVDTTLVGVWEIEPDPNLAFGSADVTLRYDDALAAAAEVEDWQDKLNVFRNSGTGWIRVPGATVDTENHRITATGLDGFSQIAVGLYEPPAGSVVIVR